MEPHPFFTEGLFICAETVLSSARMQHLFSIVATMNYLEGISNMNRKKSVLRLTMIALFCALAYLCLFVCCYLHSDQESYHQ